MVNIFLAGFNMIPLMPLDGAKVAHWNIGIYIGAFALIIGLGIFIWFGILG
jgi:Zn-dependent protease